MVKKRTMGSLYFDDTPVEVGSKYRDQVLTIGDTVAGKEITWVEANGLLIADRCVCTYISAEQLDDLGFTKGKLITIDGQRYLCRLLKVGAELDVPNEWDAALDATSEDDDLWHWRGMFFWGQEPVDGSPASRAYRGYYSSRGWRYFSASYRDVHVGFRPALEPLDPDTLDSDYRRNMKIVRDGKEIELTPEEVKALLEENSLTAAAAAVDLMLNAEPYKPSERVRNEAIIRYLEGMKMTEEQAKKSIGEAVLEVIRNSFVGDSRVAGGYICVHGYADLDEKDLDEDEETPTCVLCVEENWLDNYIKPEWNSLWEFLSEYTYDAVEGMKDVAIGACALAFEYCDRYEGGFKLHSEGNPAALKAMLGFLTGMLSVAGHGEASEWLKKELRL